MSAPKSRSAKSSSQEVKKSTKPRAMPRPAAGSAKKSDRYVVIMAGGRGERFWPISREKTPKQLIRLLGERSFLQQAVDRVRPLVPAENILVITNTAQAGEVRKQLPELPKDNVIAEPVGRDTCAAVALAAAVVGARSATATMAVLPADHVIPEPKKFQQVLSDALELAARSPVIVTIGIKPNAPETGYGYIRHEISELPATGVGRRLKTACFPVEQFVEKPPLEKAIAYVTAGNYRWNAGMFVWSYATVRAALATHVPDMHSAVLRWLDAAAESPAALVRILAREYPEIRKVSIDYALMEKARNVVVADGDFAWDDLGAWPALSRHVKNDTEGNAIVGDLVHVDAARNVVYDARKVHRTPVMLVGVKDSIVVLADDAVLIAVKSEAQKIKDLVKHLATDPRYRGLV